VSKADYKYAFKYPGKIKYKPELEKSMKSLFDQNGRIFNNYRLNSMIIIKQPNKNPGRFPPNF
jgi:hypothetical protein